MIPLFLQARSDAEAPFVTRLASRRSADARESFCLSSTPTQSLWCGMEGLFTLAHPQDGLAGDVVLVDPAARRAERLLRAGSPHNSLLVTEQCDQLCVMCSQPPKKTHRDRFEHFEAACRLAEQGSVIGITGGEPTLHIGPLLAMIERLLADRPDLSFHILSNGQHFDAANTARLAGRLRTNVVWGIPLYAADASLHDHIVGKTGAFERLIESFAHLLIAGARIELRTVMLEDNLDALAGLARFVAHNLPHIEQWSLMGLENIGFARRRWDRLHIDLRARFAPVGDAIDRASLYGVPVRLFNVPLCHIPPAFRDFAVASISDWKQRFAPVCEGCSVRADCAGFFEWHPDHLVEEVVPL